MSKREINSGIGDHFKGRDIIAERVSGTANDKMPFK